MWQSGNLIPIQKLKNKDFLLFKFNCGLCNEETKVRCIDFDINFFLRNEDIPIQQNLACPYCDKSNYHDIEIKLKDGSHLQIIIESEGYIFEPNPVNQNSISYSCNQDDIGLDEIELLLELDLIEEVFGINPYKLFITSIDDVRLLCLTIEAKQNEMIRKMIYSNIITILETYISQIVLNATYCDDNVLINIVEKSDIFQNKKVEYKEIYQVLKTIKMDVLNILKDKVFHNINFVIPLLKKGLGINISTKVGSIGKYIKIRHDIVHRNGKTKDNELHKIQIEEIEILIQDVNSLVEFIESEIKRLGISLSGSSKK